MFRSTFSPHVAALARHICWLAFVLVPSSLVPSSLVLAQETAETRDVAGNAEVESLMKQFVPKGVMSDGSQPTPPQEALKTFRSRSGLNIELVAHEPEVSQPLFLSWDSRGRMWVVQYRQYQFPAGLKVVRYDQYLRAVFDRVPEPPPRGVPGADKISVLEDTDHDGRYDKVTDVITGLNIASSVQVGPDGIWVLNPPYLLFYPDRNQDDVPDGDPEVHLSGFGLQDTHSVANSLLWGPDGWLYGANGSTTAGTVSSAVTRGVQFSGQCIWRYDPRSRVFEIFAEGGGNTFSLDIDARGQVFSGTNGGNTRGYHYPQGSYAEKNWGKHGPLTNPHAFGYFKAMPFQGDGRRFAQAFTIYEGGLLPEEYNGTIMAPNSLHNIVWNSDLIPLGSTYRTEDRENLVESSDRWFRPVYAGVGPDGAVYIADWYDTRLSHVSPVDDWHKESGRIYRVQPADVTPRYDAGDLAQASLDQLIDNFQHPNKWVRVRSSLEIGWRDDASCLARLIQCVDAEGSLEALWAIHALRELTAERANGWLTHASPDIRRWVVRLLGDRRESLPALVELAARERDLQVKSQLASTAKRLNADVGLGILTGLIESTDGDDLHLPLMYWWALETHANKWEEIESWLARESLWKSTLFRQELLGRLTQRYAAEGPAIGFKRCEQLLSMASHEAVQEVILTSLEKSLVGRDDVMLSEALEEALAQHKLRRGDHPVVLKIREGDDASVNQGVALLRDKTTPSSLRLELIQAFEDRTPQQAVATLLSIGTGASGDDPAIQRAAIMALARFDGTSIGKQLVGAFYSRISNEHDLRATACRTLAARGEWARLLVQEVNKWRLPATDVPPDVIQQLRSYSDPVLATEVERAFGKPLSVLAPEKVAEIKRLTAYLDGATGDLERGKEIFSKKCGVCHQLFGEGATVGPPLDHYQRGDIKFWLAGIIEPSLEIREGYQSYLALTEDGRAVTGMISAQDGDQVTIRTAENRELVFVRDELEELNALKTSLMPEQLLSDLSDQQIADLFSYLSYKAKTN